MTTLIDVDEPIREKLQDLVDAAHNLTMTLDIESLRTQDCDRLYDLEEKIAWLKANLP